MAGGGGGGGGAYLDSLYIDYGLCGWFPLGIFFLHAFVGFTNVFLYLGNTLVTWTPDRRRLGAGNSTVGAVNGSDGAGVDEDGYPLNYPDSMESMAFEWKLLGEKEYLLNMTDVSFFVGCLVGCLFCGALSDAFGRRRVVVVSGFLAGVVGLQTIWVPNLFVYCGIRFCLGVCFTGLSTMSSYKTEIFSSKHRFLPINADPAWTLGGCSLPLINYLVPNWRHFCCLIYGFALLVAPAVLLMPESPAWLIQKGRVDEAFRVLKGVAESRGKRLDEEEFFKRVAQGDGKGNGKGEKLLADENDSAKPTSTAPPTDLTAPPTDANGPTWLRSAPCAVERRMELDLADARLRDGSLTSVTPEVTPEAVTLFSEALSPTDAASEGPSPAPSASRRISGAVAKKDDDAAPLASSSSPPPPPPPPRDRLRTAVRNSSFLLLLLISSSFLSFCQLVYIGITFSYGTLAGDRRLNFFLLLVTGLPARFVAAAVTFRFRRRPSLSAAFGSVAACFLTLAVTRGVVGVDVDAQLPVFRKALNIGAKTLESVAKKISVLTIQENLPTSLRARAYLVAVFGGRLTAIGATYVSYFQRRAPLAVETIIGVAGATVAGMVWMLPETKDQPLTLRLEDLGEIGPGRWRRKKNKGGRGEGEREEEERSL